MFHLRSSTILAVVVITITSTVFACDKQQVSTDPLTDLCVDELKVVADFSAKAKICGPDKTERDELRMSLANAMFINCQTQCAYNIVGASPSTFKYSKSGKCWQKSNGPNCQGATQEENDFGANRKALFCPVTDDELPAEDPCVATKTEFTTLEMGATCADPVVGIQYSPGVRACNEKHTGDVTIAIANGMFGFVQGSQTKDCSATCLYSATKDSSYEWSPTESCWNKVADNYKCNDNVHEREAANELKSTLCPLPPPPQSPEDGASVVGGSPVIEECVQVRNELTTDLMDGLCAHEQPCDTTTDTCMSTTGANRGPTAVGCNPDDTHNVRLSLANGLFGGNSGEKRDCGAHCLYDYITPFNVGYKWDALMQCWGRKQGNVQNCGGPSERAYAVKRQSSLCPPTAAPTLSPSFTMPPTDSPTNAPTTSFPTVSPTTSPTTSTPTVAPTTSSPTSNPTTSPTSSPTPSPTISPTVYCIQFNYTLTTDIVEDFCDDIKCEGTSCKSEIDAELGPDAQACSSDDQEQLELSIANGMFGAADGAERNCDAVCIWDYLKPNKRSYKWDGSKQCWKRKSQKCFSGDREERVFSKDRQELFCTVKDPSQQVDVGEEQQVVRHRVRGRWVR